MSAAASEETGFGHISTQNGSGIPCMASALSAVQPLSGWTAAASAWFISESRRPNSVSAGELPSSGCGLTLEVQIGFTVPLRTLQKPVHWGGGATRLIGKNMAPDSPRIRHGVNGYLFRFALDGIKVPGVPSHKPGWKVADVDDTPYHPCAHEFILPLACSQCTSRLIRNHSRAWPAAAVTTVLGAADAFACSDLRCPASMRAPLSWYAETGG